MLYLIKIETKISKCRKGKEMRRDLEIQLPKRKLGLKIHKIRIHKTVIQV
jgi:hypothetical protein